MNRWFLIAAALAAGCSSGGSESRDDSKLAEIEATHQQGATTIVERTTFVYEGSKLKEVAKLVNGMQRTRSTFTYGAAGIDKVEIVDADNDRATQQFIYTDSQLTRVRFEIPGIQVSERAYTYDRDHGNRVKEIAFTNTWNGGTPQTAVAKLEYDAEGRWTRVTTASVDDQDTVEMKYSPDGLLERVMRFDGSAHRATHNYSYTPDGKLDEILDAQNARHSITYDESDRLAEVRWIGSGHTTTYRYTYADGAVSGLSFAPALPNAELFDLSGESFSTISLTQWSPDAATEVGE